MPAPSHDAAPPVAPVPFSNLPRWWGQCPTPACKAKRNPDMMPLLKAVVAASHGDVSEFVFGAQDVFEQVANAAYGGGASEEELLAVVHKDIVTKLRGYSSTGFKLRVNSCAPAKLQVIYDVSHVAVHGRDVEFQVEHARLDKQRIAVLTMGLSLLQKLKIVKQLVDKSPPTVARCMFAMDCTEHSDTAPEHATFHHVRARSPRARDAPVRACRMRACQISIFQVTFEANVVAARDDVNSMVRRVLQRAWRRRPP